ncbi:isoamylase early set domain-containing protein [Catenovulum sp. SM1970]|uniref:isoamylase early set domain-containing protein n=1 Tax=Marinifaba aquimaris TaxID=2741323 RepID=UPI001574ED12|nr:isoamylase early set domain-containing protein [Marinifaba aquimaris]NTS75572.1 isoamylase early set domain-containing protein [Marinifaba aquimaris]
MSLKKQFLKSKPVCKVTFRLTKEQAKSADKVNLVGDFNDWDKEAIEMTKLKSGDFSVVVSLESGQSYQFRYLLNESEWENDWDADDYVPSSIGDSDNSVVTCQAA